MLTMRAREEERGSAGHSVMLDGPLTAMEAMVGMFIEMSFIATFTQRYFGK